jgi:glycosyltransferase involved in cell wall biosynthesis
MQRQQILATKPMANGRPTKLLIATTHRGVAGGTETYLRALLPALEKRGYELGLLYDLPAGDVAPIDAACSALPCWETATGGVDAALRWAPDACLCQGMLTPDPEERLVAHLPTILFAHGYFGTCASGTKCHGWAVPGPCGRQFGAACLALNYIAGCGVRNPMALIRNYRFQARRQKLLPRFQTVAVASRHMADEVCRHGAERVVLAPLFPTGVTPTAEPPTPRPMSGCVLVTGRLTQLKGGALLLPAVRLAADRLGCTLKCRFAGDGPEQAKLQALAQRLGVTAEFLGWCPGPRLTELRDEADVLAVPSVWPEPFGLVGIEAGCQGLPSVGFAHGGIPDWLVPGVSGQLAPTPPTVAGLADALVRAMRDPAHHQGLRVGAWEMAQRFTLERHLEILEPLIEESARCAGIVSPLWDAGLPGRDAAARTAIGARLGLPGRAPGRPAV